MIWFLNSNILFGLIVPFNVHLDDNTKLSNYIIPKHYNIYLHFEKIDNDYVYNKFNIFFTIDYITTYLRFYVEFPQSENITHHVILKKINSSSLYELWYMKYKNHFLDIHFPYLSQGDYILEIDYNITINYEESLFNSSNINEEANKAWLIGMYSQTIRPRIFPRKPTYKATFNISIRHLSKHRALSNMPIQKMDKQDGLTWTHFKETLLNPSDLVVLVVSNFTDIPVKRINFQCRQQTALYLRYAKIIIENITLHLESQWKCYKELVKVDHVAIPGFHQESMNNLGLVIYRETALIYNEKSDPVIRKIDVTRIVGRAVIYQCFDHLSSSSSWSYLWLKEGIFMLFAADTINKIYPDFRIWDLFVVQIQQECFRLDIHSIMKPLLTKADNIDINSPFSFSSYIKAPVLLRMLQHILGNDVFWKGIEIFLNNQKYKDSLNFDDLWTAMQFVLDKSNNVYKFNIKFMMKPWTQLNYYPILKITRHDSFHMKVSLQNRLNQTVGIPITYTTQNSSDFTNTAPYFFIWVKLFNEDIFIGDTFIPWNSNDWMIVNIQQAGYYRVKYDDIYENYIARYLFNEHTKIHVLNRAQIIDDAFYFVMKGQGFLDSFLNLCTYLKRETDYIAWYPMIKAFEYMSGFFLFEESTHIKIYMRDILHELLKTITYNEKSNEKPNDLIKCLRQEAAKWACVFDDFDCKSAAVSKLTSYWDIKKKYKVEKLLPEWKKWAYCNSIMFNTTIWWEVFYIWANNSDYKLLEYISFCPSPVYNVTINFLYIIANKSDHCGKKDCKNITMKPIDRINSYLLTVAKHVQDNRILNHILDYFMDIKPREVSTNVALINIINHIRSKDQLDKVYEAVSLMVEGHVIHVSTMIVQQKIDVRLLEIASQRQHFENLISK